MARDFHEGSGTPAKQIVFSVKAGHVTAAHVRELRGVLERERAAISVLLCVDDARIRTVFAHGPDPALGPPLPWSPQALVN